MYLPQHFEEAKTGEFYQIVRAHPLGALVVCGANGLDANHLPFELLTPPAENATLRAHVARANPVWHEVRSGDEEKWLGLFEQLSPNDKWSPGGLQQCRVVHGGARRLRRTGRRGGQLGAHQ